MGDIFVASLIRSQLRLALVVASGFLLLLAGVPLLSALLPALGSVSVFGMPLSWLLLGFGIYPVMIAAAWLFIRSATRNEDRYRALVEDQQ